MPVYLQTTTTAYLRRSEARNVSLVKYLKRPRTPSVEEAIASCGDASDERGKEVVYRHFYGVVLAITRRYVRNEFDAEELANETFIRAFNKVGSFRNAKVEVSTERAFRAWLSRIAVNISIDFIRSRKSTLSLDEVGDVLLPIEPIGSASDLDVEDIYKLLERLPAIQRVIFMMYEVEGYSHEEVGKALDIPESTSRTYLSRAKQRLKKLYAASFDVENR